MKLEKILDKLGSLEKNSFIKIIDNIISNNPKNFSKIDKILSETDKNLKSVDSQNVSHIFHLISDEYKYFIKEEFQDTSSQLDILIDILIRDGNCIMKQDWLSRLYDEELKKLKLKVKQLKTEFEDEKSDLSEERKRDYKIYMACLKEAFTNDLSNNREKKITEDELSILITLSKELELSQEEVKLINYSILPVKKYDITDIINNLKNIGVIFFLKKENAIYVSDEMVKLLRQVREKEVADKYLRSTLRLLREPIINQISKKHGVDKNLSTSEKIESIIKAGVSFSKILLNDIYKKDSPLNERKKVLNELCEKGLGITTLKGSTLEEKIDNLTLYFENIENEEKVGISNDGYEKLLVDLNNSLPKLNKQIRIQFEFQDEFVLIADFLLDYNIKPREILDLISKEDLDNFIKANGIKQRGDNILNILDHYKDSENLFLENYENVAYRNLNTLKESGVLVKEGDLGIKFEELTKKIFANLNFNVDEKLKTSINTKNDKIDILLNLGNKEVIIAECKTSKEKGYNKFSSVSRQLKSYHSLALKNDLIIRKILLIAPEFSDEFVTDCEMDTELNLSLIQASSLLKIHNAFKDSKYTEFPYVLFRDIVINEERIIKAISK